MQSSKRTLRSHEIPVQPIFLTGSNSSGGGSIANSLAMSSAPTSLNASSINNSSFASISGSGVGGGASNASAGPSFFEADLDLHFSLQYPHFIKRDGNRYVYCVSCCVDVAADSPDGLILYRFLFVFLVFFFPFSFWSTGYRYFCNDVKSIKVARFWGTRHWPKVSYEWMLCCKNRWT